jgi:cytochrome b pre-mRNA-processing protein 3
MPRKMHRLAEAFYGRQSVYRAALAMPGEQSLAAALSRNVFAGAPEGDGAERLANYVREAVRRLAEQGVDDLQRAQLAFPDPEHLAAA